MALPTMPPLFKTSLESLLSNSQSPDKVRQLNRIDKCFLWLLNRNQIWLRCTNQVTKIRDQAGYFWMKTKEYKKERRFSYKDGDVNHLIILRWNCKFYLLFSVPILFSLFEILGKFPLPSTFLFSLCKKLDYAVSMVLPVLEISDSTVCSSSKRQF